MINEGCLKNKATFHPMHSHVLLNTENLGIRALMDGKAQVQMKQKDSMYYYIVH